MSIQIDDLSKEPLMDDPFVKEIIQYSKGKDLFKYKPDDLKELRRYLVGKSLDFFYRQNPEQFGQIFDNLDINPDKASLKDVANIAVSSDKLRGDGQKKYMIKNPPKGGPTYGSSGTTGVQPVKIYRSPIDITIEREANMNHMEYILGHKMDEGLVMFFAAPEMADIMSFVGLVSDAMKYRGLEVVYGMKVEDKEKPGPIWTKLVPDKKSITKFYRSKTEPKYVFSANIGIQNILGTFDFGNSAKELFRRVIFKHYMKVPPLNLGRYGAIATGGGSKGANVLPIEELVEKRKDKIIARDENGNKIPAPWTDILGHTEHLLTVMGKPNTTHKIPHPLDEVFLVDKDTFEIIGEGEGLLGIYNPLCTTYMEAFYPGDIMRVIPDENYYGKVFEFVRRLKPEEGGLDRACGGFFEQAEALRNK